MAAQALAAQQAAAHESPCRYLDLFIDYPLSPTISPAVGRTIERTATTTTTTATATTATTVTTTEAAEITPSIGPTRREEDRRAQPKGVSDVGSIEFDREEVKVCVGGVLGQHVQFESEAVLMEKPVCVVKGVLQE